MLYKSDVNSLENLARFKKMTQTIKNTSLAIEKWRKQYKTPPLLYKSNVNSQENLARIKKVTQTIKNTSLAIEKWRKENKNTSVAV